MTNITELRILRRLKKQADELNNIVEGVRYRDWRDERGMRLKDTKEWCAFYVALCKCEKEGA